MEQINVAQIIGNFAKIGIFLVLFSLGLGLTLRQLKEFWQQPVLVVKSFLAVNLLVPIAAFLLVISVFHGLPSSTRIVLLIMAAVPSAPMIVKTVPKKVGRFDFVAPLQVSLAWLSIVTIPLVVVFLKHWFSVSGWNVTPQSVAPQILQAQLLPLGIGMFLREVAPEWADALQKPVAKIGNTIFIALLLLILAIALPKVWLFTKGQFISVLAMSIMIIISLAIGHFMGGPTEDLRSALAVVTSMRNAGLALVLVMTNIPSLKEVRIEIITYALLTAILSTIYVKWRKRTNAQKQINPEEDTPPTS
jgi:bile acid:Na+ symporter, BASS family